MNKQWLEIQVPTTPESEDAISNFLFEIGCGGCHQDGDLLHAYFSEVQEAESLLRRVANYLKELARCGVNAPAGAPRLVAVPDVDWNSEWKKRFKPIAVSEKFIVKPTWERLERPTSAFVLDIDPKQAFGTGSHETTRLMLQLLEQENLSGAAVLDVGTGTGILAIAAMKLGAEHVVAIDNDPVAVEAAAENIERNVGKADIQLLAAAPDSCGAEPESFDLVMANITTNVIFSYLEFLAAVVRPGGLLLLSGILLTELPEVKNRLRGFPELAVREERPLGEWVALALVKS